MDDQTPMPPEAESAQAEVTPKQGWLARSVRWLAFTNVGRGVFVLAFVGMLFGGTWAYHFSESTTFCTTCHTMIPQEKSHAAGVHEEVNCGECHVSPGAMGWIRAKIGGLQELRALVTNTYERPIGTPDRFSRPVLPVPGRAYVTSGKIPSAKSTCMACHSIESINAPGEPTKLILRKHYSSDATNTMTWLSVYIRPSAIGANNADMSDISLSQDREAIEGVHWHMTKDVVIWNNEGANGPIPLVEYKNAKGELVSFIQSSELGRTANPTQDIAKLKAKLASRAMDCVDCHNRVGHEIPSIDKSIDVAIEKGVLSASLPFIKRDVLQLLNTKFATEDLANKAFTQWAKTYAANNPNISKSAIDAAVKGIKSVYDEIFTPAMSTGPSSYINNLGHNSGPGTGCWRCHDGTHVKVVNGVAERQVIPSTCSTCHSFPLATPEKTQLPKGTAPASHRTNAFIFEHKSLVSSVAAAFSGQADCATCHQKSSCESCHEAPIAPVSHDGMLTNHGNEARRVGVSTCLSCHQLTFCAQCHGSGNSSSLSRPTIGVPKESVTKE